MLFELFTPMIAISKKYKKYLIQNEIFIMNIEPYINNYVKKIIQYNLMLNEVLITLMSHVYLL